MAAFGSHDRLFLSKNSARVGEIEFFRAVIAAVVILAWQLVRGRKFRLPASRKSLILLMASGAMIGFNWIFLLVAYHYTSVSVATLSYYFAPVIVMAACPLLFRERLSLKQIICFACSTAGLVLVISSGGLEGGSSNVTGVGYGLGAAVLYACIILINKSLTGIDGIDRTLLQFLVGLIVMFPYVLFKSGFHVMEAGTVGIMNLLVLGVVTYGNRLLPLFFIAWRFERAGSGNFELHRSSGCLRYVGIRNGRGHGTDAGGGRCDDTRIYIV